MNHSLLILALGLSLTHCGLIKETKNVGSPPSNPNNTVNNKPNDSNKVSPEQVLSHFNNLNSFFKIEAGMFFVNDIQKTFTQGSLVCDSRAQKTSVILKIEGAYAYTFEKEH